MQTHRLDSKPPAQRRDQDGAGMIVFDPARMAEVSAAVFDPGSYGDRAQPVQGSGGRGSAWFVEAGFGQGVLRHYRRGGLMARFSRDAYLWRGESSTRSLREFDLLAKLHATGLPVPAPLAACFRRQGVLYRAAILVQRIPDVRSFAQCVGEEKADAPWEAAGKTLAGFHRLAAHHADLNAHNILVDGDSKVWIIDWDRGRIEGGAASWQMAVIARLERSLRKIFRGMTEEIISTGMQRLRAAHDVELMP